ncbi:SoxR reducing system RseC family protein [Desulfonatronum thiosulfatophilum]|uniref:SoxR reducing system RseC family protein n=1 Tax=Desulfonatronum thiosulfatophilum TaxID=617002 RepID=UPI000B8885A2|nr:SoxR reducing system RseC family protein [Desulfonatronum thiosulfatophilum]
MMPFTGKVVSRQGLQAQVLPDSSEKCTTCSCASPCKDQGLSSRVITVQNPIGAAVGQSVLMIEQHRAKTAAPFILFLIPLVGLFCGVLAATCCLMPFSNEDLNVFLGAAAGLATGFVLARRIATIFFPENLSFPLIVEIVSPSANQPTPRKTS